MTAEPRLLFSTAPFFRQPLREAFRHAAEAGFDGVEVMVTGDPATREPHLLNGLAREFGLTVAAVHAPFLLVTRRVWGTAPVGKIYRAVHLAEEVGAGLVVAHPPFRWQARYRVWMQESLAEFSSTTGVTVAVENMFPIRLPADRKVRFHADTSIDETQRAPHLVLDTSHAAVAGLDVRKAFAADRDRIRHVHLSNNAGKGWDSHLPVDQDGVIPIPELLADISADGFHGNVSLELDLRAWMKDEAALQELLVRNREICERHLTLC